MKRLKLKKLVAAALTVATISAVSPMAASAAWKYNNRGWWNTEGNSYSIGWKQIDGTWYHFDSVGYMSTGWVQDGESWYYMNPISNGSMGAMQTGWIQSPYSGKWYYMNPISDGTKGAMETGWINDNGTWYFADNSGAMQTGWLQSPYSGKWYYMNPVSDGTRGAMQIGWIQSPYSGKWYYMNPVENEFKGAMETGWVNDNGTWYFTDNSGAMQTGVIEVNDKVYYLQPSGAMATGTVEINGTKYTFNASGECIGDTPKVDKVFNSNGVVVNTGSTDNNGSSSDSDTKTSSGSSSHGGGSHGGGRSANSTSPTVPSDNINDLYSSYAKLKNVEGKENTYEFQIPSLEEKNEADYVTRDIFVTGAETVNEETKDGKTIYTIVPEKGQDSVVVKGVVRVVRNGEISYVTSIVE